MLRSAFVLFLALLSEGESDSASAFLLFECWLVLDPRRLLHLRPLLFDDGQKVDGDLNTLVVFQSPAVKILVGYVLRHGLPRLRLPFSRLERDIDTLPLEQLDRLRPVPPLDQDIAVHVDGIALAVIANGVLEIFELLALHHREHTGRWVHSISGDHLCLP